jgi:hypothetical protein
MVRFSKAMIVFDVNCTPSAERSSWRDSEFVCALADAHRHLGHLIKNERWHAYDATHSEMPSHGFKYLGAFAELSSAKLAVEFAVWRMPARLGAKPGFVN